MSQKCISYDRTKLVVLSTGLSPVSGVGTSGEFLRQTVTSCCGKYNIVFEISTNGPVVQDPVFDSTETVTVSKGNCVVHRAVFATKTGSNGSTKPGKWLDCSDCSGYKNSLSTCNPNVGTLCFCKNCEK